MMASLRREIAENLDGLMATCPDTLDGDRRAVRYMRGADTLRWVEDSGLDPDADRLEELEQLSEVLAGALVEILTLGMAQKDKATALPPAAFRDAVLDRVASVREFL